MLVRYRVVYAYTCEIYAYMCQDRVVCASEIQATKGYWVKAPGGRSLLHKPCILISILNGVSDVCRMSVGKCHSSPSIPPASYEECALFLAFYWERVPSLLGRYACLWGRVIGKAACSVHACATNPPPINVAQDGPKCRLWAAAIPPT